MNQTAEIRNQRENPDPGSRNQRENLNQEAGGANSSRNQEPGGANSSRNQEAGGANSSRNQDAGGANSCRNQEAGGANKRGAGVLIWVGASVMFFGCVLISLALALPPPGVIDNSVLLAFGEISTFSATVMGVGAARRAHKAP